MPPGDRRASHRLRTGQAGNGYAILPPEENADIMLGYQKTAIDCPTRSVILGTNTKLVTLTEDERRRHEAILARMAQKAALMRRKLPRELPGGEEEAAWREVRG